MTIRPVSFALLTFAIAAGCNSGPRALVPGEDACATCRMTIDDVRYGAMVLTARGKLQTFDSIECLATFVRTLPPAAAPRAIWVADFEHPSRWLDATRARFLHGSTLHSPMGRDLAAFPEHAPAAAIVQKFGGSAIGWTDVLDLAGQALSATAH
jgi:copper chaperone NosL